LDKIPVAEGWKYELVAIQPRRGLPRFLISVRKRTCPSCAKGVRTISVWGTLRGTSEEVAWCGHCFNATCFPVRLNRQEMLRLLALRELAAGRPVPSCWEAVRPALEDLERRGLL
jgi:hypothetical protein